MIRRCLRPPATTNFEYKVGQLLLCCTDQAVGLVPGRGNRLFSSLVSRLGPRTTRQHFQCVPGVLLLGIKRLWHRSDHSPPTSTNTKNLWRYTYTTLYTFTTLCLSMGATCNNSYMGQFYIQVRPSKSLSSIISTVCRQLISDFQHMITFVCQVVSVFTYCMYLFNSTLTNFSIPHQLATATFPF